MVTPFMIYFFYITIMCGPDLSTDIENKSNEYEGYKQNSHASFTW